MDCNCRIIDEKSGLHDPIQHAKHEERERCAKIAEDHKSECNAAQDKCDAFELCHQRIAEKIRERK